jgi:hypothetical protein
LIGEIVCFLLGKFCVASEPYAVNQDEWKLGILSAKRVGTAKRNNFEFFQWTEIDN